MMHYSMQRLAILLGLLVLLVVGFFYVLLPKERSASTSLSYVWSIWPGQYPVLIAHKLGYFEQEGVDLELIDGNANYEDSMNQVAEGKVNAVSFTLYDVLRRISEGKKLRIVALSDRSKGAEGLIVQPQIMSVNDLKGQRVGVLKDSYLEYFLERILMKYGLTSQDVQVVNIIPEDSLVEYDEKNLAGMVTWEPKLGEVVAKRGLRVMADSDDFPGVNTGVIAFHGDYVDAHKKAVQGFVKAWYRAVDYLKENPDESMRIVAQYYPFSAEDARVFMLQDEVMDRKDSLSAMAYSSGFESLHGNSDQILKFINKSRPIGDISTLEFIDPSFMRALSNDLDENIH
jgi:NitT/TauT family transport system substrate-binding protein